MIVNILYAHRVIGIEYITKTTVRYETCGNKPYICASDLITMLFPSFLPSSVAVLSLKGPWLLTLDASLIYLDSWYDYFGQMTSTTQRPLPTQDSTTQKHKHKHPSLTLDSKPRPQRLSEQGLWRYFLA
jgi:hypothetical protein